MNLKQEDTDKISKMKNKSKVDKDAYLESIAESLIIIAHKLGRKLL